ncbi:MAG: S41 family peptidase [Candidatus Caldatribacteriota bacterium]
MLARYLAIIALSSSFISHTVNAQTPAPKISENKSRFEQLELFNKVLHLVETQYYRPVSTEKLIEGALKGMMDTLDPHSSFLNKEYFEKMQNDTRGEFGGLGLEVSQKDGVIYVITPIEDTPAFKAGLKPRDRIVEINHEPVVGMNLDQVVEKMRGKIGEKITLGILREGSEGIKQFTMKREVIKIKPVKYELIEDHYAYIRLSQFQKHSTSSVVEALTKLKKQAKNNIKGIILDLRSNPGGLLDQAVDIASLFLSDGVVVSTEARDPQNKEIRYVKKSGYKDLTTPLVVLINGSSASASEIVAGALQDHNRAVIMGSQSFGKGSVQTVAQLDKTTGVKLTIAQYMTPSDKKIQAVGIIPDVKLFEVDQEAFEKSLKEDRFLREKDLRNHLTATIETPEEEKMRLNLEKEERARRIKEMEEKKKAAKKDKEDIFRAFNPKEDYQVLQAVRYIEGAAAFARTKNNK